ncbi:MAG: phage antirepressor KilAC domain-containing protein [Ruminococcus flavefaciens]|nr:phage antirepressor KilAC domain-containing protein [Ruminococcus flavefaciens]
MNNVIPINYSGDRPTVLGRELHKELEVNTRYNDWFKRMCEYGFTENTDFYSILSKTSEGGRPATDHQLTIPMAKEICMLQRTDKGKEIRKYFIAVEEQWNSPEAVMARALQIANSNLLQLETKCSQLETTVAVQEQQISELQPKASYYDVVLNCPDLLSTSVIAKDYGKSAKWLNDYLHKNGVQFKQGGVWLLYAKYAQLGYTSTKTHNVNGSDGCQHAKVHTYWTQKGRLFIYDLLKSNGFLPIIECRQ